MARRADRRQTWIELGVRNAGIRTAFTGMTWALSWIIAAKDLDHDPTVEEVADWWKDSHRTAYRQQAAFRRAYPDLESPGAMFADPEADAVAAELAKTIGKSGRVKSLATIEQTVLRIGLLAVR